MNKRTSHRIVVGFIAGVVGVAAGCGESADPRFAAATNDEYTEPLVDAVIATPAGTTVVSATGVTTVIPAASPKKATGGSTGTAGFAGTGAGGVGGAAGHGVAGATGTGGVATGGIGGSGIGTGGIGGSGIGSGGSGIATGGIFGSGGTGAGGISGTGGTGTGGIFGGGGFGPDAGAGGSSPGGFGFWHFDDCASGSHFLTDSSGFGANAQQPLGAACVPGISNLGVQIRSAKDIIQVPDQPQFTVSNRVAVAAWVHPNTVSGNQPIIIKRLNNQTSFSLGIHNGNIEMSVVLTTGKTFISSAPISPGVWTHVAGMYDGTFVFLFINGQQFGQVFAGGTLRNVFAPLRFGATTQSQFLDGILDDVFVSTQAISKDDLTALSCITRPSTLSVSPAASGPTSVDTSAHFDVSVANNDVGACQAKGYNLFFTSSDPGITINIPFPPGSFQSAVPGQTVTFGVDVTGTEDADPGVHQLPFFIDAFATQFEELSGQLAFELSPQTGCFVSTRRELMITTTSVVDDPVRTVGDGAWSFGHVLRQLAPSEAQAPAFALQLFQHWLADQSVNGFTVSARTAAQQQILDQWPKTPAGDLDLDHAPFALQAIVNRFDVRDPANGSAGQGRLVYALTPPNFGFGEEFTVILEYGLPAATDQEVTDWANRWHALSSHPFPSEEYNVALEGVTRMFTERNAAPARVNGSALQQLRTNDFLLSGFTRWELREFQLSASTGFFDQVTVKETPDISFNNTPAFASAVNLKADAIVKVVPGAPSQTMPDKLDDGTSFVAGSAFNDFFFWTAPGITDPDARFHASLNTCNGCHGPETNTNFLMVFPRSIGFEASLSSFLTGTTVTDPFTGQPRTLNDLGRRRDDLTSVVCAPAAAPIAAK